MTPQELIQMRHELGLTQEEFARIIEVGRTAVTNWERLDGKHPINKVWEGRIRQAYAEFRKEWAQKLLEENRQLLAEVKRLEGIIDRMARILAKPLEWKRMTPRQKKFVRQGLEIYDERIGKGDLRYYMRGENQ